MPTEPFETVDDASALLPSQLFFTQVDEMLLRFEGFSFLVVPLPFSGLDAFEVSASFTFPT